MRKIVIFTVILTLIFTLVGFALQNEPDTEVAKKHQLILYMR